jgi:hypothetical protein
MASEELTAKMIDLSKRKGVELSEVTRLYNMELVKVTADTNIPAENKETVAWWKTGLYVEQKYGRPVVDSERIRSAPGDLEGFLIGNGEFRDKKGEMISYVDKQLLSAGKSACEKRGLIKIDGLNVIKLDYRDKVYGKTNPSLGKPLNDVDIDSEMTVYAVARRVDSDDPFVFATVRTSTSVIANSWYKSIKFPEHLFVPIKFNGNIKETLTGFSVTASTAEDKVTKFNIDKAPRFKVEKAMEEAIDPLVTPWVWEDGDENHETNPILSAYFAHKASGKNGKPVFDRMMFLKGVVDNIRPEWKNWKGTPAYICNKDDVVQRIRIYLPAGFEKQFGESSLIYAYGKEDEIMQQDQNGNYTVPTGRLQVKCVGAYPIPGLKTAPSEKRTLKEFNAFG